MLRLERRCTVADETGLRRTFRVVATLADGTLILVGELVASRLSAIAADEGLSAGVIHELRQNLVAFDVESGTFLTDRDRQDRIAREANPLLSLVARSA